MAKIPPHSPNCNARYLEHYNPAQLGIAEPPQ
jgi:hypothetical protein